MDSEKINFCIHHITKGFLYINGGMMMNPGLTGYRGSPCNCGCVFTSKSSMGGMGVGDNLPKCFQNLLTALCGE